jgi:hypothetical protein
MGGGPTPSNVDCKPYKRIKDLSELVVGFVEKA